MNANPENEDKAYPLPECSTDSENDQNGEWTIKFRCEKELIDRVKRVAAAHHMKYTTWTRDVVWEAVEDFEADGRRRGWSQSSKSIIEKDGQPESPVAPHGVRPGLNTLNEAAVKLCVSRRTVKNLVAKKQIDAVCIGEDSKLISDLSIQRFIARNTVKASFSPKGMINEPGQSHQMGIQHLNTLAEAAVKLHVTRRTVSNYIADKWIDVVECGPRNKFITDLAIERFIEKRTIKAAFPSKYLTTRGL